VWSRGVFGAAQTIFLIFSMGSHILTFTIVFNVMTLPVSTRFPNLKPFMDLEFNFYRHNFLGVDWYDRFVDIYTAADTEESFLLICCMWVDIFTESCDGWMTLNCDQLSYLLVQQY
jgi:hypothetical protein